MSDELVTIGPFSMMLTAFSIATLRHYDDIGLLRSAEIDPRTSYRPYSYDQIDDTHGGSGFDGNRPEDAQAVLVSGQAAYVLARVPGRDQYWGRVRSRAGDRVRVLEGGARHRARKLGRGKQRLTAHSLS
jgi:hypothetical protein